MRKDTGEGAGLISRDVGLGVLATAAPVQSKGQVVLVGDFVFPDGDAAASRIMSIARMFRDLGYCVDVVANRSARPQDALPSGEGYEFDGVQYTTVTRFRIRGVRRYLHPLRRLGVYATTLHSVVRSDVRAVIMNLSGSVVHAPAVSTYCNKRGIPFVGDVGEWYDARQFKRGYFDPVYWVFTALFRFWFPRLRNMITGSRLLERHFSKSVPSVIRIPASLDVQATPCGDNTPRGRLVLLYAGGPGRKGSDLEFARCGLLSAAERERVELRIVGIPEPELARILGPAAGIVAQLERNVVLTGRVPRDRVLDELQGAHFSLLLRPNERYANAGFPSKVSESLGAGTPVMLNFTSDLEEYLGDGAACIEIRGNSAEAVSAAIRRALTMTPDELGAMRRAARAKAEQFFDHSHFMAACSVLLKRNR